MAEAKPCIVCNKTLANVHEDVDNLPSNGTTFFSQGQYGSTVWDPMNPNLWLEINVCDECLVEAAGASKVFRVKQARTESKVDYSDWDGGP